MSEESCIMRGCHSNGDADLNAAFRIVMRDINEQFQGAFVISRVGT